MTDVVDAPTAVKPINHWIAGGSYAGESGRTAPVYNPARGEQTGAVDLASVQEVDANPNPLREEVMPLELRDGSVTLTDAPGLGVEPDLKRLARFVVRVD